MRILRKIERIWTGKILKDYGMIGECKSKFKHYVFLTRKENEMKVVIKEIVTDFFKADIRYFEFNRTETQKLKDVLDDALKKM